jgi:poly(glycerol-phosphate) alpha-glucosyltransferase
VSDVSDLPLPSGHYVSVPIDMPLDSGGQTRALLMRNRILVQDAGVRASVFTFAAYPDLAGRIAELNRHGLLIPEIQVENIYDYLRDHDWPTDLGSPAGPRPLPEVDAIKVDVEERADGSPFRRIHRTAHGRVVDYLRADGSTYLRVPGFYFSQSETWPTSVLAVDEQERVVHDFGSLHAWFTHWVRRMTGGERTFLFMDSRYVAQHLMPLDLPQVHPIYVLHNIHVQPPRHWSSPVPEMYDRVLAGLDSLDGFVTITRRQRDDIARRFGERTNLHTVPHAVDVMPEIDPTRPRDPHRVSLVARLSPQKRVVDAVRVIDRVRREVPDVQFHVYGDGPRRAQIQEEVDRLGLQGNVTLFGHRADAKETLATSSAFLVTSAFEGWNLAMQESMSRGCPVVAYDIKYGPREQIDDGVDGFLVPDGDLEEMARRVVQLLTDPALVDRMGERARDRTAHSRERFVRDWARVVESVIQGRARRVERIDLQLLAAHVEVTGRGVLGRRTGALNVDATVRLAVHRADPSGPAVQPTWTLAALEPVSGAYGEIPVVAEQIDTEAGTYRLRGHVSLADIPRPCWLRLTVSAENAAAQAWVRGDGGVVGLAPRGSVREKAEADEPALSAFGGRAVTGG